MTRPGARRDAGASATLFFGVGAAKAGTSWLHSVLAAHPEVHFRSIKELHYFDAIEGGWLARERRWHERLQRDLLARIVPAGGHATRGQSARLEDRAAWLDVLEKGREDRAAYLAYLRHGAGSARVIGEVTPAYALLPEARLRAMAGLAPDTRFLYLLRDPVERLWSHVRMMAVRRDPDGRLTTRRAARILARTLAGEEEQIARRGDYAGALDRLGRAVPEGSLLVESFEEMIAGPGLRRIFDFLGLGPAPAPGPAEFEGVPLAMTAEQRRAARDWLAPQYEAAITALGRVPPGWDASEIGKNRSKSEA